MGLGKFFSKRGAQRAAKPAEPGLRSNASPKSDSPDHTLRAFGEALDRLSEQTVQLGDHVAKMVENCAAVFLNHDATAAKQLIQDDLEADKLKDAINSGTIDVLARHQPVASDLRLILAAEHVAGDLERAADHAKNIAKRALATPQDVTVDPAVRELLLRLHKTVLGMLVKSLLAFKNGDASLAADVRKTDQDSDTLNDDLFHTVIAHLRLDSSRAATDVQALFVGKSLERIGDHATNIAEKASFRARGERVSSTRNQ